MVFNISVEQPEDLLIEKPKFNYWQKVNYYFSPTKQAVITGMAYTSFIPYEQPAWHYHLESDNKAYWFQGWVEETELYFGHKNRDN